MLNFLNILFVVKLLRKVFVTILSIKLNERIQEVKSAIKKYLLYLSIVSGFILRMENV